MNKEILNVLTGGIIGLVLAIIWLVWYGIWLNRTFKAWNKRENKKLLERLQVMKEEGEKELARMNEEHERLRAQWREEES